MDCFNVEKITANDEIGRIIHEKILTDRCPNYFLLGEDRTSLPENFLKYALPIKHFEVYNDDVWVISYPKTGTTWMTEMVWMIANNLDFEGGKKSVLERFLYLELCGIGHELNLAGALSLDPNENHVNSFAAAKNKERPRLIKTHLPHSLLPDEIKHKSKTPKIIYVWRNFKDTCVSYYHHGTLMEGWRSDLETFARLFMADKAMYGSIWKHVLNYWDLRGSPNILFIKYEDMKADLPAIIRRVSKFLEKELTENQIETLTEHLSFRCMQNNPAVNYEYVLDKMRKDNAVVKDGSFIRCGVVGKYKEELSPETIKKLDEWIKEKICGTSIESEYNFEL